MTRGSRAASAAGTSRDAARNRKRSEHAIVSAVGSVLAREGFTGIGVNALAREAGVDKVLIYRYFGGLKEVIGAFAREVEFWPTLDELTGYTDDLLLSKAPEERLAAFFKNLARAIARRPATRAILAWHLAEQNELTEELERARLEMRDAFLDRFFRVEHTPMLLHTMELCEHGVIAMLTNRMMRIVPDPGAIGTPGGVASDTGGPDARRAWHEIDEAIETVCAGIRDRLA